MNAPLIFVDLIEEQPLDLEGFTAREVGETRVDTALRHDREYFEGEHKEYLAAFQPWRILVKSGDNEEPLFRSTERYFNRADAIHAAELAFGSGSNVYLREAEHGNVKLRLAADG